MILSIAVTVNFPGSTVIGIGVRECVSVHVKAKKEKKKKKAISFKL